MFFQKDYAKPGPGVRPDEPEKTGLRRFAEILQLESYLQRVSSNLDVFQEAAGAEREESAAK